MIYKIEVECPYCEKKHVYPLEVKQPKPKKKVKK